MTTQHTLGDWYAADTTVHNISKSASVLVRKLERPAYKRGIDRPACCTDHCTVIQVLGDVASERDLLGVILTLQRLRGNSLTPVTRTGKHARKRR